MTTADVAAVCICSLLTVGLPVFLGLWIRHGLKLIDMLAGYLDDPEVY